MNTSSVPKPESHPIFSRVQSNIRHDLLRFPYTLIILECTR